MNKPGLKNLVTLRQSITDQMEASQASLIAVDAQIGAIVDETLNYIRAAQGKDTGAITAVIDEVEIKQDVPKRVAWDQEIMQDIREKIIAAKDDPDLYMATKFTIPEKNYNNFTTAVKSFFVAARTIKTGKTKLTFKIKEE